jgi:hypothetical protein
MKYKVGDKVRFVKDYTLGTGEVIPVNSIWEVKKVLDAHYRFECADKQLVAMIESKTAENYCERINTEPSITKRINNKHNILNSLLQTDGSVDLERLVSKLENNSAVEHPAHYNQGKIEVIDFIEDKDLNFALGNAVKYICRCEKKNPKKRAEDLRKAVFYLNRQIAIWEREDNQ